MNTIYNGTPDTRLYKEVLGKTIGKDAAVGKLTWVAVRGVEQTRADAAGEVQQAIEALNVVGGETNFLKTLAQSTLNRVQ